MMESERGRHFQPSVLDALHDGFEEVAEIHRTLDD